jgi:hypothetical protein
MDKLKGLYLSLHDGCHTYGIQAINDPIAYDKLLSLFYSMEYAWFKQGDSRDKSWLYIEFNGK